ncbi:restriction endonuclease [Mariprofundus ferrooxydans]|uniref:restriction endonuclease n=1 Tax=Mariprofundus ferrooxydans TaxID=314344 RepID=UPI00142F65A1|nr:restriction endonuclease [Mariprofundus ferrooxydans]
MTGTGQIQISRFEKKYTSTGKHSGYMVKMYHKGLDETRHLSASDPSILDGKINNQVNTWNKKWERQVAIQDKNDKEEQAQELTRASKDALAAVEGLLAYTLKIDDAVDWDTLKNKEAYPVEKPMQPVLIQEPKKPVHSQYMTKAPFFKALFGGRAKHEEQQEIKYQKAMERWKVANASAKDRNKIIKKKHLTAVEKWAFQKAEFNEKQALFNNKVDALKGRYQNKDPEAIVEYCEVVLNNSEYPDSFPKDFEIQFNENNGMLLVDFQLPSVDDIPKRTMVRYVKARDEFEEKFLSQVAQGKLFDSVLYQVALRTLHELFEADVIDVISCITFNGIITALNPATGHNDTKCIMSIQTSKSEFSEINLASIDPKSCFKSLKGVGSAKLSSITPVRPILELDKSDKRFRDHYEVANSMDESTNLAAMDWEDFEHLVREIFEKEFVQNGGEVKVTQASSDGGVDAIAFDPDPIRGGKIVIQAKRYTNTVGVAAVRDLYGTVMNEGATKGILVTTSDYGADSYGFAKGKPLTLLNGSNLLHLLEKHGHQAKIDIKEAKILMKDI